MNRLIPINEREVKQNRRFDQKSNLRKSQKNPTKKKNGRTVKERTFVNREKPTNAFVKTNGSVNARKITKPKKNRSRVFFKTKGFFYRKPVNSKTAGGSSTSAGLGGVGCGLRGGSGGEGLRARALPAAGDEATAGGGGG